MCKVPFSILLSAMRFNADLTNKALAEKACVPESLIAGLQAGSRRVGEKQARRIGAAFGYNGEKLEHFVLVAVDTSTKKVLEAFKRYPAQVLNHLPKQLEQAGIKAEDISGLDVQRNGQASEISIVTAEGRRAKLSTKVAYE